MDILEEIVVHEFLECAEGSTAVDALAGNGDALLDTLLALLQHLDAEGGIGQHDVLLGGQGTILQYTVKNLCSLFLCGTTNKLLRFGNLETKVTGLDILIIPQIIWHDV